MCPFCGLYTVQDHLVSKNTCVGDNALRSGSFRLILALSRGSSAYYHTGIGFLVTFFCQVMSLLLTFALEYLYVVHPCLLLFSLVLTLVVQIPILSSVMPSQFKLYIMTYCNPIPHCYLKLCTFYKFLACTFIKTANNS